MPDVFALAGIQSLSRLRTPELQIAVADDGADAKAAATTKLATVSNNLAVSRDLIAALDARVKLRRPIPVPAPQESLQSLVRRGRRRLETERLGTHQNLVTIRQTAVTKLQTVLGIG